MSDSRRRNAAGARFGQRGAALLIAMIIVALIATLASAMVWQQWRAVQVETVERARTQSAWILAGASDWARLILREDDPSRDYLGEPWSLPLQEARLSTFLASDKDNTDDAPEAFLSGQIVDAQSRYNLRNLASLPVPDDQAKELVRLVNLLDSIGVNGSDLGPRLASAMRAAFPQAPAASTANSTTTDSTSSTASTSSSTSSTSTASTTATVATTSAVSTYLQPQSIDELSWFGVDDDTITRMKPFFTILPTATLVNVNTAPKEVIAAVSGVEVGVAQQLVMRRANKPLSNVNSDIAGIVALNADQQNVIAAHLDVKSSYFEIYGRLRLADRVLEERSLVRRTSLTGPGVVTLIQRRRQSLRDVTN